MAKKYRKKPVVVEALQWTGSNLEEVEEFVGGSLITESHNLDDGVKDGSTETTIIRKSATGTECGMRCIRLIWLQKQE